MYIVGWIAEYVRRIDLRLRTDSRFPRMKVQIIAIP